MRIINVKCESLLKHAVPHSVTDYIPPSGWEVLHYLQIKLNHSLAFSLQYWPTTAGSFPSMTNRVWIYILLTYCGYISLNYLSSDLVRTKVHLLSGLVVFRCAGVRNADWSVTFPRRRWGWALWVHQIWHPPLPSLANQRGQEPDRTGDYQYTYIIRHTLSHIGQDIFLHCTHEWLSIHAFLLITTLQGDLSCN